MRFAADSDAELLDAAVQHAVAIHGHHDTVELRAQLRTLFKTEGGVHEALLALAVREGPFDAVMQRP